MRAPSSYRTPSSYVVSPLRAALQSESAHEVEREQTPNAPHSAPPHAAHAPRDSGSAHFHGNERRAESTGTPDQCAAASPAPAQAGESRHALARRLVEMALVQYLLRPPAKAPRRVAPEPDAPLSDDPIAAQFGLVRRLANWLGQPERCGRAPCRRAKLCRGDPPDCWRGAPPPSADELALAKYEFRAALAAGRAQMNEEARA